MNAEVEALWSCMAILVLTAAAVGYVCQACEADDSVPVVPVGAPESAASSGCVEVTWACCRLEIEAPTCKDGEPSCREGFVTCEADGGE